MSRALLFPVVGLAAIVLYGTTTTSRRAAETVPAAAPPSVEQWPADSDATPALRPDTTSAPADAEVVRTPRRPTVERRELRL